MFGIVKVDSKGRITIPRDVREAAGLGHGTLLTLALDVDTREILLAPIASRSNTVHELDLVLDSATGSLAALYGFLASNNVNVLYSRCLNLIHRGHNICTFLVDVSHAGRSWEEIAGDLKKLSGVVELETRKIKPEV